MKGLRQVRERARLTGAEQEPGHGQGGPVPHPAGGGGEEGPPQDDANQHLARTDAVAEVPGGDFKERVSQRERGKHPAHLRLVQVQVAADEGGRLRDANPVNVLNDRQRHREDDHPVAGAGRRQRGERSRGRRGQFIGRRIPHSGSVVMSPSRRNEKLRRALGKLAQFAH